MELIFCSFYSPWDRAITLPLYSSPFGKNTFLVKLCFLKRFILLFLVFRNEKKKNKPVVRMRADSCRFTSEEDVCTTVEYFLKSRSIFIIVFFSCFRKVHRCYFYFLYATHDLWHTDFRRHNKGNIKMKVIRRITGYRSTTIQYIFNYNRRNTRKCHKIINRRGTIYIYIYVTTV
jgi:hypothetical protein